MPTILDKIAKQGWLVNKFKQLQRLKNKSWDRFESTKVPGFTRDDALWERNQRAYKLEEAISKEYRDLINDIDEKKDRNLFLGFMRKCRDEGYEDCDEPFIEYMVPKIERFNEKLESDPLELPYSKPWYNNARSNTVNRLQHFLITGED